MKKRPWLETEYKDEDDNKLKLKELLKDKPLGAFIISSLNKDKDLYKLQIIQADGTIDSQNIVYSKRVLSDKSDPPQQPSHREIYIGNIVSFLQYVSDILSSETRDEDTFLKRCFKQQYCGHMSREKAEAELKKMWQNDPTKKGTWLLRNASIKDHHAISSIEPPDGKIEHQLIYLNNRILKKIAPPSDQAIGISVDQLPFYLKNYLSNLLIAKQAHTTIKKK